MVFLVVTYLLPMLAMAVSYSIIGEEGDVGQYGPNQTPAKHAQCAITFSDSAAMSPYSPRIGTQPDG